MTKAEKLSNTDAAFCVAPSGDDHNPGILAKPFATLPRAQTAVRTLKKKGLDRDVVVFLREGTYCLDQPLVFNAEDGGTDKYKVTYKAFPGEKVMISGGRLITGWKQSGNLWTVELPEVKSGKWYFRQLFVNGRRATRARTPNADAKTPYHQIEGMEMIPGKNGNTAAVKLRDKGAVRAWENLADVEMVWLGQWQIARRTIDLADAEAGKVSFFPPHLFFMDYHKPAPVNSQPVKWCFFENAREMLDQPGEWYLDRATGILSYWPLEGETIDSVKAVAPVVNKTLINAAGTAEYPVRNLHFDGIQIAHVDWPLPTYGYMERQAALYYILPGERDQAQSACKPVDGTVSFRYVHAGSFTKGVISHAGGTGLRICEGCRDIIIEGSQMYDIGANGIFAGEPWDYRYMEKNFPDGEKIFFDNPPAKTMTLENIRIINNHVHDCGVLDFGGVGIVTAFADGAVISRNLVHDLPYSGISAGLMWRDDPTVCARTVIEYNHVRDVMQRLCDGGGIYTLGFQPESVIRYNLIHGLRRSPFANNRPHNPAPVCALYLDQGTKGFTIEGNIFNGPVPIHLNTSAKEGPTKREWQTWKQNFENMDPDDPRFKALAAKSGLEMNECSATELIEHMRNTEYIHDQKIKEDKMHLQKIIDNSECKSVAAPPAAVLAAPPLSADSARTVRLIMPPNPGSLVEQAGLIFAREVGERCGARVVAAGDAALSVELAVEPGIGAEGYLIADSPNGAIRIAGNDERGLLYGVGKFLRMARYDQNGFTPGVWRGKSAPVCPVRGIYLATHFNNFYEAAAGKEVERYVESLALWGMNSLAVSFNYGWFDGFDDPKARQQIARMKSVMRAAKKAGMRAGITNKANGGFRSAPNELRATPVPDRPDAGVNLCPANPQAHEMIISNWKRMATEFADLGLDFVIFFPYDEGGCNCGDCAPWGARGYPKLCRELTQILRAKHPEIKIVLSTWFFDYSRKTAAAADNHDDVHNACQEWEGLAKFLAQDKSWINYIMADTHEGDFPRFPLDKGVPGGLPLLNFPEISMFKSFPWGGYGANPAPRRFQRLWDQTRKKLSGGFPYSEGIYEDINKAIWSQFYWNPDCLAADTVKEYAAFEYSPDIADDALNIIENLEQDLIHIAKRIKTSKTEESPQRVHSCYSLESVDECWAVRLPEAGGELEQYEQRAEKAYALAQQVNAKLTPQARAGWRWRIVYLRALIDRELARTSGRLEGAALKAAFDELTCICHAGNTSKVLHPPRLGVTGSRKRQPPTRSKSTEKDE